MLTDTAALTQQPFTVLGNCQRWLWSRGAGHHRNRTAVWHEVLCWHKLEFNGDVYVCWAAQAHRPLPRLLAPGLTLRDCALQPGPLQSCWETLGILRQGVLRVPAPKAKLWQHVAHVGHAWEGS